MPNRDQQAKTAVVNDIQKAREARTAELEAEQVNNPPPAEEARDKTDAEVLLEQQAAGAQEDEGGGIGFSVDELFGAYGAVQFENHKLRQQNQQLRQQMLTYKNMATKLAEEAKTK